MRRRVWTIGAAFLVTGGIAFAWSRVEASPPSQLPSTAALQQALIAAPGIGGQAGGLFGGTRMWAAMVNRNGEVVGAVTSTPDPTQVWPGSEAISKSKAFTANAFSIDSLPLSTAMLYTFTQPGHSLSSLGQSQSGLVQVPPATKFGDSRVPGGLIFFGGGVPLYKNGKIIGGLGVSGDTASCDHEIAKRVRDILGLNPPGGKLADDISYSSVDGASAFTHPLSLNTFRNGTFIGTEQAAVGY
jgi:uncharacterized protein GlcG (DUF336 family)